MLKSRYRTVVAILAVNIYSMFQLILCKCGCLCGVNAFVSHVEVGDLSLAGDAPVVEIGTQLMEPDAMLTSSPSGVPTDGRKYGHQHRCLYGTIRLCLCRLEAYWNVSINP